MPPDLVPARTPPPRPGVQRHATVELFRDRLVQVMAKSEMTQTAFARAAGIDRSTLSQLLAPGNERLPRIESVIAIARMCNVSLDWLFGLSQRAQAGADVMSETLRIERDAPNPLDERLVRWHAEAAGYRIRHVPSTLPDVLKTEAVINVEYERFFALSPRRRIEITQSRLDYLRRPETDMEVCTSIQAIESFARGEDHWRDLPAKLRREQIEHIMALCDELYPRFRWFLYDARQVYSVPVTIFGPLRAAVYVGQMYFVFSATEHIRALTQHFDSLIRVAVVQPTDIVRHLGRLLRMARD